MKEQCSVAERDNFGLSRSRVVATRQWIDRAVAAVATAPLEVSSCWKGGRSDIWTMEAELVEREGRGKQWMSWTMMVGVPMVFVVLVFGVVPLDSPLQHDIREQNVFIYVTNPIMFGAISYIYFCINEGLRQVDHPFSMPLLYVLLVAAVEILTFLPIATLVHTSFTLSGVVAVLLCITTVSLILITRYQTDALPFLLRVLIPLLFFLLILVGYVYVYDVATNEGQAWLVVGIAFLTFVFRRVELGLLDVFPLELSMLISGFWFQNLSDMLQTLAFPRVTNPLNYMTIWVTNAFANVAMLFFISDRWILHLRPTLKSFFTRKHVGFNYEHDLADRGHGENVPGYRRRQFRFFFWRLASQASAMLYYVVVTPVTRFGINRDFFPQIDAEAYKHSLGYATGNLFFVLAVLVSGMWWFRRRYASLYADLRRTAFFNTDVRHFFGFFTAILAHNMVLATGLLLQHYCIYEAYKRACRVT